MATGIPRNNRKKLTRVKKQSTDEVPANGKPTPPDNSDENDDDADVHLHGFSTDDDSSDDDVADIDPPAIDVEKLPTIAKDDATVREKLEKAKRQPVRPSCLVLYSSSPLFKTYNIHRATNPASCTWAVSPTGSTKRN
jgi:nucleolar protein 15